MEEQKKMLEQEVRELEQIEKAAKQALKNAPKGCLRITKNKNTDQYYWRREPTDTEGRYIRKNEQELIKGLAQKDYAQKVLAILEPCIQRKRADIVESSAREKLQQVYDDLSAARQKLVIPYVYSDEEFVAMWEEEKKIEKVQKQRHANSFEIKTEIQTEKGEYVRSKSEKILADKLSLMQIPYAYELPLFLNGYGYINPDFTVLNKRTRKEYYWEHFGLMDEKEYCEKAIKKIESLGKNGIFPGKNLIMTFETKENPLNMKIAERLIEEYLL